MTLIQLDASLDLRGNGRGSSSRKKAIHLHRLNPTPLLSAYRSLTVISATRQRSMRPAHMSRKGNCLDNGATEQVFGHIKDEFFRGRTWPDFESFESDLDAYVAHWNTRRRQVKLKGLTPEEFRSQSFAA